jgi:hypothetical protein
VWRPIAQVSPTASPVVCKMSRTDDGGAISPVHERLGPCGREVLAAGGASDAFTLSVVALTGPILCTPSVSAHAQLPPTACVGLSLELNARASAQTVGPTFGGEGSLAPTPSSAPIAEDGVSAPMDSVSPATDRVMVSAPLISEMPFNAAEANPSDNDMINEGIPDVNPIPSEPCTSNEALAPVLASLGSQPADVPPVCYGNVVIQVKESVVPSVLEKTKTSTVCSQRPQHDVGKPSCDEEAAISCNDLGKITKPVQQLLPMPIDKKEFAKHRHRCLAVVEEWLLPILGPQACRLRSSEASYQKFGFHC